MNRLREYRESLGLTQAELAKEAGVSRATIIDIESGNKSDVKISTLNALAIALKSDIATIFFGK